MEVRTIDYVVPMVFHNDPLWQEDFRAVNHQYDEGNLIDFVRFRSWGTERLLIQCVKRYMPFLRTIYIILARESQKQAWMDEEGVRVVYHRDFIPERFLPTFNSTAIEMFLHRIPGISDRFLYGNDDMFPLSPLSESDFFENDVPCQHHVEAPFPQSPNIFHNMCRNGLNFVAKEFGIKYETTWLKGGHSITPMLKSTWEYLWQRGASEIEASVTPFRESRNFIQWIHPWWHHLSGNYVSHVPRRIYLNVRKSVEDITAAICCDNPGIVCINDNECEEDYMKYGRAVTMAIEEKLNS